MIRSRRLVLSITVAGLFLLPAGCSRDKSDPAPAEQPVARATSTAPLRAITAVLNTPTTEPTPSSSPTATGTPPAGTPTATPRVVNGLQVVDETWVGVVRESGGLRIRSTPNVTPDNVVGSVPQNTEFTVIGRVLNGQEAETGKGTVWLIVAPNQYIYHAPGYIDRVR